MKIRHGVRNAKLLFFLAVATLIVFLQFNESCERSFTISIHAQHPRLMMASFMFISFARSAKRVVHPVAIFGAAEESSHM